MLDVGFAHFSDMARDQASEGNTAGAVPHHVGFGVASRISRDRFRVGGFHVRLGHTLERNEASNRFGDAATHGEQAMVAENGGPIGAEGICDALATRDPTVTRPSSTST